MTRPPVTEGADMRGDDDLGHDQPPKQPPHAATRSVRCASSGIASKAMPTAKPEGA